MQPDRPNILFILSDDQGAWAMHCAGARELETPNLDRIAAEGMRFSSFFCASPVCSPARASILTGTIPSRHGVHDWLRSGNLDARRYAEAGRENPYGHYADEDEPIQYLMGQPTYTDLLRERGYNLALSGKWHLGDSVHPQHGFTRWFTIGQGGCMYFHPDIVENEKITVRHGEYVTDLITDRALDFLDELASEPNPFYLSVHYTAPHSPWDADQHPQRLIEKYDKCTFDDIPDLPDHPDSTVSNRSTDPIHGTPRRHDNLRGYYAAITAMDEGIGRILDRLEEKGLAQNTLVIFNGDNGMSMGHHGIWGKGNGTFPMNMYDTAVKVPFLIRWPGHTIPGTVCDELTSAYDLFPTIAEIVGSRSKAWADRPGHSFLPSIEGRSPGDVKKEIVVYDEYGPVRMIRTKDWKYIHRYPYGPHELYDLLHDPDEMNNLANAPEQADRIISMRARLQDWFTRYADPARDGLFEDVTGSGQLCSAGIFSEKRVKYAPNAR